jgi:ABC-type lipoprotein export system ATPase subunit
VAIISIRNLVKSYGKGESKKYIFNGLNLDIESNSFVSILGRSGSGKTTLLNAISTLDNFDSGKIIIDGFNISKLPTKTLNRLRNRYVGFVFQDFNLIEDLSILDNVALPLIINNHSNKVARKLAANALTKVGLNQFLKLKPQELSGGQKQRVAVARAIVNEQKIILCDEPTGALDDYTSMQILKLLKELAEERTIIMVTHDEEYAKKFSDRIIVLSDGDIIYDSDEEKTITNDLEDNTNVKLKKNHFNFKNVFVLANTSFSFHNKYLKRAMNRIINSTIIFLLASFIANLVFKYLAPLFINISYTPIFRALFSNDETPNQIIFGIIYLMLVISFISFIFIFNMVINGRKRETAILKAFGADKSLIIKLYVINTLSYTLNILKKLVIRLFIILVLINSMSSFKLILLADYTTFISNIFTAAINILKGAFSENPAIVTVNFLYFILTFIGIVAFLCLEVLVSAIFMSRENTIRVLARE